MEQKLIAFHGDAAVKEKYINRLKEHAKADEFIQGTYWQGGKGCAVGCTIHGSEHYKYETELGITRILARLEDRIFEGLSNKDAKRFPLQFLNAIPVGADVSQVWRKFLVWILVDKKHGVIRFSREQDKKVLLDVADVLRKQSKGIEVRTEQLRAVGLAAWEAKGSATAYAANAAGYAAATACAAYTADAADAADYAAIAAIAAIAYDDAGQKHYKIMAHKLIKLLKAAK